MGQATGQMRSQAHRLPAKFSGHRMFFKVDAVAREGVSGRACTIRYIAHVAAEPRTAPPTITVTFPDDRRPDETESEMMDRCTAAAEAMIGQLYLQLSR